MLALLFVAFLLALLIGFDVGFSMIFSAWLGILANQGELIDAVMMPLSMIVLISCGSPLVILPNTE